MKLTLRTERKFRDKKQQQQLQLQQQQQQEQQQQRQRTNSYLQSATVPAPSRGRASTHEDLHVRPHLKHMPHQAAHGLPLRIAAPAFSAPDYSSLSSYGSELDEVISPEELSYFPSAEHCGLSEDLDLEFSHFALSSSSLGQNMVRHLIIRSRKDFILIVSNYRFKHLSRTSHSPM